MMSRVKGRLAGRLLVASPTLKDPNFRWSVILMLDHGDQGAIGLVMNRPLDVDVAAVLPAWQPYATRPGRLYCGGPVQEDSALGLVAVPGDGPEPHGVRRLIGGLGLVDLDAEPDALAGGVAGLRIFAGYAGWSAGQVEAEIAEGSWYVVSAEARDPFSDSPASLWATVLRRQRGELALLSTFPDDPSLN